MNDVARNLKEIFWDSDIIFDFKNEDNSSEEMEHHVSVSDILKSD
jgi:hypothetical protein